MKLEIEYMLSLCVKIVDSLCVKIVGFVECNFQGISCGLNYIYSQRYTVFMNSFSAVFFQKVDKLTDVFELNPQKTSKLLLRLRFINLINNIGETL